MTTTITTRAGKGSPLTHAELDANFTNLQTTADAAADAVVAVGGKANASAIGVAADATNLGTFTGSTISDNTDVKSALQEIETALEGASSPAATKAEASALGVAAAALHMGTYTGSTISDNQTAKQNIQQLETAVELRTTIADLASTASGKGAELVAGAMRCIRPEDYGAAGDGTTNDYTAFAAADVAAAAAGIPLAITKTYRLNTSYTTTAVVVWTGGKIKPASGTTTTIGAGINAPAVQVFDTSLGGTIALNARYAPWGWAEWWGLTAESAGAAAANIASINAAITALRETCLQARTYYTNAQISLTVAGKRLRGCGHQYDGTTEGRVTRIICTSATAHILYMGDTAFSSIAALPRGIFASDLFLTRSVGPDVTSACSGVYAKWTLFSGLERVKTDNCVYGFQFGGNVHFKGIDLHTNRSTAGTGGTDIFHGFHIDGSVNIGANGGNASLYLIRCNAEGGIAISNSVGFYADQKMTDLFIHYPETSNFTTGIELAGPASNTTLNYDTIDVEILAPKLDTFSFAGIYIHGMNKYGSVEVTGGYYGAKSGATAAINVVDNLSAVCVSGGQFLMGVAATTFGIRVKDSSNVIIDRCMINEADAYAVVLDGASNSKFIPLVKNHSATCDAAVALLNTNTANIIEPMVSGGSGKVAVGVQVIGIAFTFTGALVGATSGTLSAAFTGATGSYSVVFSDGSRRDVTFTNGATTATWTGAVTATASATYASVVRSKFEMTGVDSGCVSGGASNKMLLGGYSVATAGTLGTNVFSGVMA